MEEVNIFSTNQNYKPISGWIPPKVNAGIVNPGFIGVTGALGTIFYPVIGGTIISASSCVPQMLVSSDQNWVTNQPRVFESTVWQSNLKNLNIYTASDFVGEFALKYQIIDPERVYDFLFNNEFLTPLVRQAIIKSEDYFQDRIKNLYLKVQEDPEDEGENSTLILQIEFSGTIQSAYELLTKFQTEWFIPNFGSKIAQFSVEII